MNLIDICIMTIIVSFIMRIKAKLEIYKDISDLGYKLNHKKLQELNDKNNENIDIVTQIIKGYYMYIPFYNLFEDAIRESNYYKNKNAQIERLKKFGAIEEMTQKEKEEYGKNRTGFQAVKMEKRHLKKLSNSSLAEFSNGSKIWFNFKDDIDDTDSPTDIIEIVEVSGIYKNLNNEELKQKVYYSLLVVGDKIINEVENSDLKEDSQIVEKIVEIPLHNEQKENIKPKTRIKKRDK